MSVTVEDVRKVARLARIKIEDSKIEHIQEGLNDILKFIEQLDEVNCSQVDDSVEYATGAHEREDVAVKCNPSVMDNATQKECNMFVVPKVVG